MSTTVWVKLVFTGKDAAAMAAGAVEVELDVGTLQDAINDQGAGDLHIASATIENVGMTRGDGRVLLTERQAAAAGLAVGAMIAGGRGGDWADDSPVTDKDMAGAAKKLGVR